MSERIALLEGDDVDARKTLGDAPATRWQEEVDARRGKELGERARERHGEQGVAHAIVAAHDQDAAELGGVGPAAPQRQERRGEAGGEARREPGRRVHPWVARPHAPSRTCPQAGRTSVAGSIFKQAWWP